MGCSFSAQRVANGSASPDDAAYWDPTNECVLWGRRILASGALKLLSARWLLRQPPTWRVQRHQELPEDAFLPPAEAARLFCKTYGVVVLSYGWLSKQHPDPEAFHFALVRLCLELLLPFMRSLPEEMALDDVGVFWDFASLPQPPKTEAEQDSFKQGLGAINLLYGSPLTFVLLQKQMPGAGGAGEEPNLRPYEERGWCTFEEAVSGILKPTARCMDLGAVERARLEACTCWRSSDGAVHGITELCTASRRPPMHPDDMEAVLAGMTFTNRADCQLVAQKYRSFFNVTSSTARCLAWPCRGGGGWGEAEVRELVRVLPIFRNCTKLCLDEHPLDDECVGMLVAVLGKLPRLSTLRLQACELIGDAGVDHLAGALPEMSALTRLVLPAHLQGSASAQRLEEVWRSLARPVNERDAGVFFAS